MRGLVFAQSINKPGRCDASGAFIPSAKHFCRFHGLNPYIPLDDVDDRNKMINAIDRARGLDVVAYFGHGEGSKLGSADIILKDQTDLANALRKAVVHGGCFITYACTSGKPGCFNEKLAGLLGGRIKVWGHTCAGHTYTNPYVTRYPFADEDDQPFLIEPIDDFDADDKKDMLACNPKNKIKTTGLFKKWYKAIKEPNADIQARYPFMSKRLVELEMLTGVRMSLSMPTHMIDAIEDGWKKAQKNFTKMQQQAQKQAAKAAHAPR